MHKTTSILLAIVLIMTASIYADEGKYHRERISEQQKLIYNIEFELERNADPATSNIPTNIRQQEIEFVRNIPYYNENNSMKKLNGNDLVQSAGINFNWRQRGPWNTGGRFLCIALDTDNENIINAGAASGGMWRSIDKGKSWVKTSDLLSVQSIYCLTQDKRKGKHNVWYYGTGEMLSTTDRSVSTRIRTMNTGGGIWKSIDNGATWQALQSTLGGDPAHPSNPFQGVWNIVLDEKNKDADIIYAACYGGIYRSEDGGKKWDMVLGDKTNKPFSSYIIQNKSGVFFAAVAFMTLSGEQPAQWGIFRSTDGKNWKKLSPKKFPVQLRTIKLAASASNPNIVYVLAERPYNSNDPLTFSMNGKEHFFWKYMDKSDGNGKWEDRTKYLPDGEHDIDEFNTLGSYAMTLMVKPDDENTVIIGGTNIYVSKDAFSSYDKITHIGGYMTKAGYDLKNEHCHPDIHGFAIPASDSKTLFVANDGGIHYTKDYTAEEPEWASLNNGLFATQFYTIAIDHATKNDPFVFGGLQDNSSQFTFSNDVKVDWNAAIGGDGMAAAVADNKEFILGSWYFGGMVSFQFINHSQPYRQVYHNPNFFKEQTFAFYTIFEFDKNDYNTLYIPATRNLLRKTKFKRATRARKYVDSNWKKIATVAKGHSITALAVSEKPADIVYIGTSKGKVYRIDNAKSDNPQMLEITDKGFPANAYCSGIDVDPRNANDIIVVFSNYHVKSIFHSSDGGASFANVSGNLEDNPDGSGSGPGIRRVKKIYTQSGKAFYLAATTSGLFVNTGPFDEHSFNTQWEGVGARKFGSVIVDWIDASPVSNNVVIATQGAGVWSADFSLTGVNEQRRKFSFSLGNCYPNPTSTRTQVSFSLEKKTDISLKLFDTKGRPIALIAEGVYPEGNTVIDYDGTKLSAGAYFLTLRANGEAITKRLIIVK